MKLAESSDIQWTDWNFISDGNGKALSEKKFDSVLSSKVKEFIRYRINPLHKFKIDCGMSSEFKVLTELQVKWTAYRLFETVKLILEMVDSTTLHLQ